MLQISNLNAWYGASHAIQDINIEIAKGEIVCLIGRNGAGKTTLLRAISGVQPISGGSIRFAGEPIDGLRAHQRVGRGIAQVPEGRQVFTPLTVDDNLRLGAYTRADHEIAADLDQVYSTFPALAEKRAITAGALSGGQQQMLAIGRALMSRPRLLLVDEASLGLSPALTQTVFSVVDRINDDGVTVVLVEQNVGVLPYADRALIMEKGTLVYQGSGDEIHSGSIRETYLGTPA